MPHWDVEVLRTIQVVQRARRTAEGATAREAEGEAAKQVGDEDPVYRDFFGAAKEPPDWATDWGTAELVSWHAGGAQRVPDDESRAVAILDIRQMAERNLRLTEKEDEQLKRLLWKAADRLREE